MPAFGKPQALYNTRLNSPLHTKVTPLRSANLFIRKSYTHIHTPMEQPIRSNMGFKILPKDTLQTGRDGDQTSDFHFKATVRVEGVKH